MKVHQITEAPKTEPSLGIGDGKPLKGQSLKLNGVNYQWKGANWIVTDTSEFKGKNPPKKGAIADRNAKALLNQQAAKVNGANAKPTSTDNKPKLTGDPKKDLVAPKKDLKPKVDEDGWMQKLKKLANNKVTRFVGKFISGKLATLIVSALNFAQLEDALDAYLRALTSYGKKLNSQEEKKRYLENAKKGRLPNEVAEAYFICQEKWSKLIIEAFIAAFISGAVIIKGGAALAGLAGIIGTGPIGWIVAITAGGALIWGGTTLLGKVFDAIGMNDIVEDYVVQPILSPNAMLSTGVAVDSFQEIIGIILDTGDAVPYIGGVVPSGDLVRDSIELDEGYVLISEGKTIPSKSEIKSNLKALMKSEPKLAKAFNKGKQQGKAAINNLI